MTTSGPKVLYVSSDGTLRVIDAASREEGKPPRLSVQWYQNGIWSHWSGDDSGLVRIIEDLLDGIFDRSLPPDSERTFQHQFGLQTCDICGKDTPRRDPKNNRGESHRQLRLMWGDRSVSVKTGETSVGLLKWKVACDGCAGRIAGAIVRELAK